MFSTALGQQRRTEKREGSNPQYAMPKPRQHEHHAPLLRPRRTDPKENGSFDEAAGQEGFEPFCKRSDALDRPPRLGRGDE